MEEPPGSLDDLQPQDLSTSGRPTVIDLSKTGEECTFSPVPIEALRVVRGPGWYSNVSTGNHALQFASSSSSNIPLQLRDPHPPDNAFSHTTVTLSYVSRSHVFSNQDSISSSAVYRVPPIGKISLCPPHNEDESLREAGCTENQTSLYELEQPLDPAVQTELFLSQAKELHEFNGEVVYSERDVEKSLRNNEDNISLEKNKGLENRQIDSLQRSELCADSSLEVVSSVPEEENDDMLVLLSKKQEPAANLEGVGTKDPCSISRKYISPLKEQLSPSSTSTDDVEGVLVLPLFSCSPSAENSNLEIMLGDSSSTEDTNQSGSDVTNETKNLQVTKGRGASLEPNVLSDKVSLLDLLENKNPTTVAHVNGNAKTLEATFSQRKLPARSGRGTRLETIVMSINSSRYKLSGSIRPKRKPKTPSSTISDSSSLSKKKISSRSVSKRRSNAKCSAKTKTKKKSVTHAKRKKTIQNSTDSVKDSTSDSEMLTSFKKLSCSTSPKSLKFTVGQRSNREVEDDSPTVPPPRSSPRRSRRKPSTPSVPSSTKTAKKEPKPSRQSKSSREPTAERVSPSTPKKQSPGKTKRKLPGRKTSPQTMKNTPATKRRKQKLKPSCFSSMFSPREPEIKLKYVNYKEKKRYSRSDSFSPFIHIDPQLSSLSLCTVINDPEEVRAQLKKQPHASGFTPAAVPSTSCLQLGRASTKGKHQNSLICCLCGQSANAMDLGDLHGPYYPEGFQSSTKEQASTPELKEDQTNCGYSNPSLSSQRSKRRKCSVLPTSLAVRQGAKLKKKHQCSGDGISSPSAKRARSDGDVVEVEDWYSPPVVPLEPCEYWLHEDCGIWSAGVFLVKGKVYGLEEAVRAAQETVCSACHSAGATLGCFSKGCAQKYHYRCALESDCVLIEENFSMKCRKHKAFKGTRWEYR